MGGWLDKLKLRLTQPQVELEAWAELGKNRVKPKTSISTSRQPRKLKFGMQAYFNSSRRNMNKRVGVTKKKRL